MMSAQCTRSATGCGIEAEALLRDHGDEAGARFEIRIVELAVALVLLEVLGVRGREKCALVMIEPPGDLGRTGVLEIDDGVLVAVELLLVEKRAGAMDQSGEFEFRIARECARDKSGRTARQRKRRQSTCRDRKPELANEFPNPPKEFPAGENSAGAGSPSGKS